MPPPAPTMLFQDEKKTLKEKVLSVQEVTSLAQTSLGYLTSLIERILKYVTGPKLR